MEAAADDDVMAVHSPIVAGPGVTEVEGSVGPDTDRGVLGCSSSVV